MTQSTTGQNNRRDSNLSQTGGWTGMTIGTVLLIATAISVVATGCAVDSVDLPSEDVQWVLSGSSTGGTVVTESGRTVEMGTLTGVVLPTPQNDPEEHDLPSCEPLGTAWVSIEASCSWGRCPTGGGVVATGLQDEHLAMGGIREALPVPAGCPFDIRVTLTGLLDNPTFERRDILIPDDGMELTIPLDIETGTVQFDVQRDGEPTSAIVYLYREVESSNAPETEACGSTGAAASSQELTAGTYVVRALSQGETAEAVFTIDAGETPRITLSL